MSRSCRDRHDGHVQCLVDRLSSASRCPHAEHVFELGYQRSIATSSRPARSHLYVSRRRNSPQPQSEMTRARCRLRTMFRTRSGPRSRSCQRSGPGRADARCRKSRRASRTLRWARATLAAALARFAEPRGSEPGVADSGRGCGLCAPDGAGWRSAPRRRSRRSPSRRGRSRPRPAAGSGCGPGASAVKVTYQRPSGSRDMITIAGSSAVMSTSGHDQTNAAARPSWPAAVRRRAGRKPTGCSARTGGSGGT